MRLSSSPIGLARPTEFEVVPWMRTGWMSWAAGRGCAVLRVCCMLVTIVDNCTEAYS